MSSHPDADAFLKSILANPAEVTTRLAFADWLEETGDPANVAWARFIRAQADAPNHAPGSPARRDREKVALRCAEHIRATVTIPAMLFVAHHPSLLQMLPPANLVVRLDGFEVAGSVLDLVPESVARENLVLPLDLVQPHDHRGYTLLAAMSDPTNYDTVQRLQFILNCDIVPVRAEPDDIRAALTRYHGNFEYENFDSVLCEFPVVERSPPPMTVVDGVAADVPVTQLVNLILAEARRRDADRVTISPIGGIYLRFREGPVWSRREPLPARLLVPTAARLAHMAGADDTFRDSGRVRGEISCRIVGGHPFTVAVTIETLEEGPVIQLDFRTEPLTTRAEF